MTRKKLIAIRKDLRMSQGQFAEVLDVSVRTLQEWEQGRRKMGRLSANHVRRELRKLQRYYWKHGTSKDWLET